MTWYSLDVANLPVSVRLGLIIPLRIDISFFFLKLDSLNGKKENQYYTTLWIIANCFSTSNAFSHLVLLMIINYLAIKHVPCFNVIVS